MVDEQELRVFCDSEYARATLCEDRACRSALAVAPCEFVACEVVFGSCRVVCAAALGVTGSIPAWSAEAFLDRIRNF